MVGLRPLLLYQYPAPGWYHRIPLPFISTVGTAPILSSTPGPCKTDQGHHFWPYKVRHHLAVVAPKIAARLGR